MCEVWQYPGFGHPLGGLGTYPQQGVYYQIGDVVSVIDEQDGKPYYAQIRGFIQDQYCEKSAALTWLIPTLSSPKDQFDPASYIIGPEEDLPRKMEYLEFVCHAPSEYFKSRSSPFPTVPTRPEKGYIWTHVGPTPAITIKETVANHLQLQNYKGEPGVYLTGRAFAHRL